MKHRNEKQQHFRFKFSKSLFRRPMESASFLALLKQQEKNWRGTLLAVITIAVISGLIILAALYMTSWEQKIEYSRFTTGEIVWISERTRNPDYLWQDDTFIYAHPNGIWQSVDFSKSDLQTFADSTRVTQTLSLNTQDLKSVSGIWPNSKRTAWLIRHDGKNVDLQDKVYRYTVILSNGGQRIPVRSPAGDSDAVHSASWAKLEFALFIQAGQHLYYSENIVSKPPHCLTCHLATIGWTFGYPGWTYRQYFHYEPSGAYQQSMDKEGRYVLVLGTDDRHLRTLSVPQFVEPFGPEKPQVRRAVYMPFDSSAKNLRVPLVNILLIDTLGVLKYNMSWDRLNEQVAHDTSEARTTTKARELFITRIQWFNATSFLIVGLRETQNCGFILFCQWFEASSKLSCQQIWYQCVEHGWLDMRTGGDSLFGVTAGENDFLTILPFIGKETAYQLVILHIIAGQKNRITWLTEAPIRVSQLVWADYKTVLFTASMQPAIRHLYRLDRGFDNKLFCLTCSELTENTIEIVPVYDISAVRIIPVEVIDRNLLPHPSKWTTRGMSFRTINEVRSSANGACFTILWSTGYEAIGAFGVREAPTRLLINQLTGTSHEAAEYDSVAFEETAHFDPDSGIGVWCQRVSPLGDVTLMWHSHLLIDSQLNQPQSVIKTTNETVIQVSLRRSRRSIVNNSPESKSTKSAKQHQIPTSTYRTKVKAKFLNASQSPLHMLYPEPPFGNRPIPNFVLRMINLDSSRKAEDLNDGDDISLSRGQREDGNNSVRTGAVVRIWFPPYLNERHLRPYPLLIQITSQFVTTTPNLERVLEELTLYMCSSLDVVVMRVQSWVGDAHLRVVKDGLAGELANYQMLFKTLSENYHYFQRNKTAFVGAQGIHSFLAGLLLRSDKTALNPSCAALISPVVNLEQHEFTEAVRIIKPQSDFQHLNFDLTKLAQNFENKELLLIHGTADTMIPFSQTMKLTASLAENKVDFSILPLYDEDHDYGSQQTRLVLLRRLAVFLTDCLSQTSAERINLHAKLHVDYPTTDVKHTG